MKITGNDDTKRIFLHYNTLFFMVVITTITSIVDSKKMIRQVPSVLPPSRE
jgi:hypothetical protein